MNKKSIKTIGTIMLAVIMIFSISMTAFASYVSIGSISFSSSKVTGRYSLDGHYMAYEYNITNSTSPYITVETYVDNVRIDSRNIAGSGKVDWLNMQSNKNHIVYFILSTTSSGQSATISLNAYSWN